MGDRFDKMMESELMQRLDEIKASEDLIARTLERLKTETSSDDGAVFDIPDEYLN